MGDSPARRVTTIAVDDRERSYRVVSALLAQPDVEVVFRRLPRGDYEVDDFLLVERKTAADFALSVIDTRLFRQAHALATRSDRRSCLVIEGDREAQSGVSLTPAAFRGAVISVALVFGVPVIHTGTPEETAAVILMAARQLARRCFAPPRRFGPRPGDLRRSQLLMLQMLPGVGAAKAARLLRTFGTPAGVAQASRDDIAAVPGFGPVISARVWRMLHAREAP